MATITLKVDGMSCQHCVSSIEKAVASLRGATKVKVDLTEKTVRVEYDPVGLKTATIKQTIEEQGYQVSDLM